MRPQRVRKSTKQRPSLGPREIVKRALQVHQPTWNRQAMPCLAVTMPQHTHPNAHHTCAPVRFCLNSCWLFCMLQVFFLIRFLLGIMLLVFSECVCASLSRFFLLTMLFEHTMYIRVEFEERDPPSFEKSRRTQTDDLCRNQLRDFAEQSINRDNVRLPS